jgi:hypothetical protein
MRSRRISAAAVAKPRAVAAACGRVPRGAPAAGLLRAHRKATPGRHPRIVRLAVEGHLLEMNPAGSVEAPLGEYLQAAGIVGEKQTPLLRAAKEGRTRTGCSVTASPIWDAIPSVTSSHSQ